MKTDLDKKDKAFPIVSKREGPKDLFQEMSEWTNRIARRAYQLFQMRGFTDGHDLDDWFAAEHEFLKPVALEVRDTIDELLVRAEVPGFEARDLVIEVEGNNLVIRGKDETTQEGKKAEGKAIYNERTAEEIYRAVALPVAVFVEAAKAELKNGVLEVKLPKAAKPKTIAVSAA